ncbi:MAG TPA: TatD family hydrolase [Patescibacteria group bacterium]|nr:TatD family hydrolase [Patescibacteria group bacterium]
MFADSHAHLSMPAFDADLAEVIARAREAGVTRMMTCATSMDDAALNLSIAQRHGLKASVGFHPHHARDWTDDSEARLRALIDTSPEIAAIGEVGLDFHYNYSPPDAQCDVLRRQIRMARSAGLPLIVHCRDAREQMKQLFVEEGAREAGGVLHCFSEDADFARFCLEQGFFVSFSGIVTFKKAEQIRDAAKLVPLDSLLVETDAPYLAPVPHRGRRNEPSHVVEVARFVAQLKAIPPEALAAATSANFDRLFSSRRRPPGRGAAEAVKDRR